MSRPVGSPQVFEHGLFHADPHPGNLLLLPGRGLDTLAPASDAALSPRPTRRSHSRADRRRRGRASPESQTVFTASSRAGGTVWSRPSTHKGDQR